MFFERNGRSVLRLVKFNFKICFFLEMNQYKHEPLHIEKLKFVKNQTEDIVVEAIKTEQSSLDLL